MLEPTRIAVFIGAMESQPLVFAHLMDAMPGLDLEEVEVICGADPAPRLAHVFPPETARAVEDAMGLMTTCVLIFAEALAPGTRLPDRTGHLVCLGTFAGHRHRPDPG